ncbi:MAG: hypothetical protein GY822_23400 [Deltaproteobacteria bacterium]|nr:hypothetical protein [Deltaproteobacteria bacterium]
MALFKRLSRRWQDFFPTFLAELTSDRYDRYRHLVELVGETFKKNAITSRFIARELLDRPEETVKWIIENGSPWLKVVTDLAARHEANDISKQGKFEMIKGAASE